MQEELVLLTQALADSPQLAGWLQQVAKLPAAQRGQALAEMTAQMEAAGESPGLVRSVAALREERVLQAVLAAVQELGGA